MIDLIPMLYRNQNAFLYLISKYNMPRTTKKNTGDLDAQFGKKTPVLEKAEVAFVNRS